MSWAAGVVSYMSYRTSERKETAAFNRFPYGRRSDRLDKKAVLRYTTD